MTELAWVLVGISGILNVFFLGKIFLLQKSVREITAAFSDRLTTDTNTLIDISSRDPYMRKLAADINVQLRLLRKERRRYQHGDLELKEAVTNISHDLRTPLTAICGYLDLLEKTELNEDARRYAEQIRNRSEALKQLTEELFRYSVISSTPEVSLEKVNLCRILEESLISFETAFADAQIEPEIQMPENPVWKKLDSSALSRIYGNIISNAIKYSDGDFSVCMDDSGTVTFSNTAKALSAVEVGKLFDRFYTVDSARKSTGLGLSIAKLLTERMGGSIEARYACGKLLISVAFEQ